MSSGTYTANMLIVFECFPILVPPKNFSRGAGLLLGSRMFALASPAKFRPTRNVLIAPPVLIWMPALDPSLRPGL